MKKLMFVALLCLNFAAAHAASIINNTACAITVQPVCYNSTCTIINYCPPITIPAGSTVPLVGCSCPPAYTGFIVCWATGDPCSGCTTICGPGGPHGCSNFPAFAQLICGPCSTNGTTTVPITWSTSGNLTIG
jgi:hypothetical protein